MKILFIVMGILSLFTSCSGRKKKLAKKEGLVLNEFEVEKSKSYLDTDALSNIVSFNNKGNDTIEVCTKKFDIATFERHKKDFVTNYHEGYKVLNDDTLRVYSKYINDNEVEYTIEEYSKESYFCYLNTYFANGNMKSKRILNITGDMYLGVSLYYSKEGKLEKEVNEDEGYCFTFQQLISLLEKRGVFIPKGITLPDGFIDYRYRISRDIIDDLVVYTVIYPLSDRKDVILSVSGKDGSIIKEIPYTIEDN